MVELLLFSVVVAVLLATGAEVLGLVGLGGSIYGAEQARKAANRQAQAMEKSSEHLAKEQQFMEELRRGFLDERAKVLEKFGGFEGLLDYYLENLSVERGGVAEKMERLAKDPALRAGARLAVADALGLNREASRRMLASLIGSGGVRGSGIARALTSEEVRRQQETERQLADLARQEALDALQMQQQASQLRESVVRERFQMPLAIEEALANRSLGIGSNIAGLAQASAQAQMQAQQFLAQQDALRAQQLAQGIAGLAQAYQQQQMMNQYFNILRNSPYFGGAPATPPTAPATGYNPVLSPLFAPTPATTNNTYLAPSPFGF